MKIAGSGFRDTENLQPTLYLSCDEAKAGNNGNRLSPAPYPHKFIIGGQ